LKLTFVGGPRRGPLAGASAEAATPLGVGR
jgi:hypothetical protein